MLKFRTFSPGMASLRGVAFVRVTLRKPATCLLCRCDLKPQDEAYRPATEGRGIVRNDRACLDCVEVKSKG